MEQFISVFIGYLKLYTPHLISVLWIGLLVECVFLFLLIKGYTKYAEKPCGTSLCGLFLSFSVAVVITMTLYGRAPGEAYTFQFLPFASYFEVMQTKNVEILLQILMNIAMFVPIGLFLPCCFSGYERNRRLFFHVLLLSLGIELTQGIGRLGMFEVDDIMDNVLGAEIGFFLWRVVFSRYLCYDFSGSLRSRKEGESEQS